MIFGFKENKCKGKVYTQDEVDNLLAGKSGTGHTHDDRYYTEEEVNATLANYKANGDFAVLTGSLTLTAGTGIIEKDFPEGFTPSNCVVISCGRDYSGNGYGYGTLAVQTEILVGLNSNKNKIEITLYDPEMSDNTVSYKIVLMKI